MEFLAKTFGTARPEEFYASWVNLETKVDLHAGDLVAIDTDYKLIKATHEHRPVGVVNITTPKGFGEAYQFTGARDNNVLKAGSRVSIYKYFLLTGTNVEGIENAKMNDPVYLGEEGLTCTKPSAGFLVGTVERITDKLVRFNLDLVHVPVAGE